MTAGKHSLHKEDRRKTYQSKRLSSEVDVPKGQRESEMRGKHVTDGEMDRAKSNLWYAACYI